MATQTLTLKKTFQPSRVHDYLYDPHHVLASERDHARATFKSHTSTDRVKRVPVYRTMFSELKHHPRFEVRLDGIDPVPKFISRQWPGHAEQAREACIRYTTFNYDPSVQVPPKHFPNAEVTGRNRYKYARRPMIPFLQQVPPEVLLASSGQDPLQVADQMAIDRPPTPLNKTVETQTDYRDSEAQTDPYTPEYVVRPGEAPELLTLATLSYGRGLPAGLAEVEMIERARAKRAWEATLPPLNDLSQLEKRKHMMDDMERKEWALREQEIEKLQEARLEMLQKLLKEREEHHQELNIRRLDKLWSKKQKVKEARIKKIRHEHIRMIRKLTVKHHNVEGRLERPEIINEYSNHDSQAYAPKTRIGVFIDRGSEQFVVKSRFLNTFQGLLELEASLPDFVIQPRIKAPKPQTVTKAGFIKRAYRKQRELLEMHETIKEAKERGVPAVKPLRFLEKIEKPVPRPPTPAVPVPFEDEEERELGIIFLQQIIRGRAIQNMMFEGKEKRMELIKELRSTHALQEAEQLLKKQELQATLALQRQRRLHEHKESLVDEALSHVEGCSIGDMVDYLSKELIRLQEERRIHAFSMLAERRRRVREAEESGLRQMEERRQREEDEIFKQVVKVHQTSVDTYLESVILGSLDDTADVQARREIEEMADKINDVAYDVEENRTQLDSEEIVADLVHCFLLPEVKKMTVREKVKRSQRKYLLAAHKEIVKDTEAVIDMTSQAVQTAKGSPQLSRETTEEELPEKPSTV
ncbi:cilia- and flagella-associated protein 91-like [Gigantopelta aegis]|uniref:cilia- and flagella-associated protein 91-like n=1 Tax=Gigantopelta aegis TaxID=1735272 RepID=UPI001B88E778|nr:cilia- and flagella-associated protein 91-like [Gigantopelta aegis]